MILVELSDGTSVKIEADGANIWNGDILLLYNKVTMTERIHNGGLFSAPKYVQHDEKHNVAGFALGAWKYWKQVDGEE